MADKTINQLTEDTSPTGGDFVPVWDGATSATKKATITNIPANAAKFSNPYKFSVYRNAATNTGNAAFALIPFDTKVFDTGTNIDVVTNKGRFTAPVAGFYYFTARGATTQGSGNNEFGLAFYKNGSALLYGQDGKQDLAGGVISCLLQLSANDYIEVFAYGGVTLVVAVGATSCWFQGFLVSAT